MESLLVVLLAAVACDTDEASHSSPSRDEAMGSSSWAYVAPLARSGPVDWPVDWLGLDSRSTRSELVVVSDRLESTT
jgi:hypothetical protein